MDPWGLLVSSPNVISELQSVKDPVANKQLKEVRRYWPCVVCTCMHMHTHMYTHTGEQRPVIADTSKFAHEFSLPFVWNTNMDVGHIEVK